MSKQIDWMVGLGKRRDSETPGRWVTRICCGLLWLSAIAGFGCAAVVGFLGSAKP
jgi:hypothetical protein